MNIDQAREALREHPEVALEMGLTSLQLMAYNYIKSKTFASGTDIAREFCTNSGGMRRLTGHLIKKKYIERCYNYDKTTRTNHYRAIR